MGSRGWICAGLSAGVSGVAEAIWICNLGGVGTLNQRKASGLITSRGLRLGKARNILLVVMAAAAMLLGGGLGARAGEGGATSKAAERRNSPGQAFEDAAAEVAPTPLDKLVSAKLASLKIPPAKACSDAVFVRRVYLDVIGTLPTAQETSEFLRDTNARKRSVLINRLLERPEYVDYWSMKWADLLRVKAEFPINLWPNAVQAYYRWIHTAVKENQPLDRFARELLTASGSNFRVGEANFYRAVQNKEPAGIAQMVALTFMGARTESWPAEQAAGVAGFFTQVGYKSTAEWKEEIVYWDRTKTDPVTTSPATAPATRAASLAAAVFPDGTPAKLTGARDPREVFADWLLEGKNPWFARAQANRIWSWLLGRGVVQEPDDIRASNPPSNPELLAYLEHELVAAKFDTKQMFRLILNSQTYQRSCVPSVPAAQRGEALANFAYYPLRRLEAEVLIDAICQITGTTEKYSSAIPEPFTFIPEEQRSIALADGSITSAFLELFGRPARDTGWESERNNKTNESQRLHLLNSSHIQRKLEGGRKLQELFGMGKNSRDAINTMYLTILSRYPTAEEMAAAQGYLQGAPATTQAASKPAGSFSGGARKREGWVDLAWALVNSTEFQYRH